MSANQEATIKISKLTHHQLRILKAEGNFKSYDALIQEVCRQWLGTNDWFPCFDQEPSLWRRSILQRPIWQWYFSSGYRDHSNCRYCQKWKNVIGLCYAWMGDRQHRSRCHPWLVSPENCWWSISFKIQWAHFQSCFRWYGQDREIKRLVGWWYRSFIHFKGCNDGEFSHVVKGCRDFESLGTKVIFTTQLFSAVDLSFLRYTALAPVLRRVDASVISQERPQFQEMVRQANYVLKSVSSKPYYRDYYFDVKNEMVCEAPFPKWIDKEHYPIEADMLSTPMKYHDVEMKMQIIGQKPPPKAKKRGRPSKTTPEDQA